VTAGGLLARFQRRWQAEGLLGLLRAVGRHCYRANSAVWFARDLTAPITDAPARLPVQVVMDQPARTLAWLRSDSHLARELEFAEQKGHLLPHALYQGRIVGWLKIGYPRVFVVDYRQIVELPAGTAMLYDSFVAPELRGQRILGQMVTEAMQELRRRGLTRMLCHIPEWNEASTKAYERCGFEPFGRVAFRRVFGLRLFLPRHPLALLKRAQK